MLFKSIFYFYKFYVMEYIMYFAFNNIYIYIYIYEIHNLINRFKLYNYNIVLYKWRRCY